MELTKFFIFFLFMGQAQAFTLNNNVSASFDREVIRVNVDDQNCTLVNVSSAEILELAHEAVNRFWNRIPSSKLVIEKGSLVSVDNAFNTDLICSGGGSTNCVPNTALSVGSDILIACNTNTSNFGDSPSVLGVTIPNNINSDVINGALILIQDTNPNSFDGLSRDEKIAVLAHEIGHAIGLGHSPVDDSLMYYASVPTRFHLGWDDIDGATYLYPAEQPISCGTIATKAPTQFWGTFVLAIFAALFVFRRRVKLV